VSHLKHTRDKLRKQQQKKKNPTTANKIDKNDFQCTTIKHSFGEKTLFKKEHDEGAYFKNSLSANFGRINDLKISRGSAFNVVSSFRNLQLGKVVFMHAQRVRYIASVQKTKQIDIYAVGWAHESV
jgi:hypothetical protein